MRELYFLDDALGDQVMLLHVSQEVRFFLREIEETDMRAKERTMKTKVDDKMNNLEVNTFSFL